MRQARTKLKPAPAPESETTTANGKPVRGTTQAKHAANGDEAMAGPPAPDVQAVARPPVGDAAAMADLTQTSRGEPLTVAWPVTGDGLAAALLARLRPREAVALLRRALDLVQATDDAAGASSPAD